MSINYDKLLDDCLTRGAAYIQAKAVKLSDHEQDCYNAILELRHRAENAETRIARLNEARENANEACAKWEWRAKKAERERDAAINELDAVVSAVDDLAEWVDNEVHPVVDYTLYTSLRENVDAISMFEHEEEWRGKQEE